MTGSGYRAAFVVSFALAAELCLPSATHAGAIEALANRMPAPAANAKAASAEIQWRGDKAVPAGHLKAALDAFHGVQAAEKAKENAFARASQAQVKAAMPGDPAAIQKKMAGMTREQQMAFAMQMSRRYSQNMMAQMRASGPPSAADEANADKAHTLITAMMMRRTKATMAFQKTMGRYGAIKSAREVVHQKIDAARQEALSRIPMHDVGEGGGGCYTAADAKRVAQIQAQYFGQHIAQANRDLAQTVKWAAAMKHEMQIGAHEIDALTQTAGNVHNALLQRQLAPSVAMQFDLTLATYFVPYLDAVRDADTDAAHWQHLQAVFARDPEHGIVCGG